MDDLVDEWNEVVELLGVGVLEELLHSNGYKGKDLVVKADDQAVDELTHTRLKGLEKGQRFVAQINASFLLIIL